jgi:hypothetical protein
MASPPPTSSSVSAISSLPRRTSKRSQSIAFNLNQSGQWGVTPSATMPSLARTGVSGGFLSRMWGAARGQPIVHDKDAVQAQYDDRHGQGQSALKRLVLAHSRSASRGLDV